VTAVYSHCPTFSLCKLGLDRDRDRDRDRVGVRDRVMVRVWS
jgi:hypothetical protein